MNFKTVPLQALAEHLAGLLGDATIDGDPTLELGGAAGLGDGGPGKASVRP